MIKTNCCNPETEKQGISDRALFENKNKCYNRFRELCEFYRKGFMAKVDVEDGFLEVIQEGFFNYIKESGLLFCIRRTDQDSWERFLEDYHLWEDGKNPSSDRGKIWLSYMDDKEKGTAYKEASHMDKSQFFKLMESFHLPIDYFQPLPNGAICPDDQPGHFPCELIVGWSIWEDDGDLLSDRFELGDIISLTDHFGLKSLIKVTEHLESEAKSKRQIYHDYIGKGYIEGYTTSRDREIYIDIKDGKVLSLTTFIDNDDKSVYNNYPLWKDAHKHHTNFLAIQNEVVCDLIQFFLHEALD